MSLEEQMLKEYHEKRFQAACAALTGYRMSLPDALDENVAIWSVEDADALLKELKKEPKKENK